MTKEQKYQLEKAIELIRYVIDNNAQAKFQITLSHWLDVAEGYCHEIAENLRGKK